METIIGNSAELILKAQRIRHQVFVEEQKIPQALELDGLDAESFHALVLNEESIVATARLFPISSNHAIMARVAVLSEYRGLGIATKMINALLQHAQQEGLNSIEIHAHEYLRHYYENFGFEFIQNVEIVGEHQLIEMRYQLATG